MKRFIGFDPFSRENAFLFFGRENFIAQVVKNIFRQRITVIHSQQATGKTSVINAGIIPALEKDLNFYPVYVAIPSYNQNQPNDPVACIRSDLDTALKATLYLDKLADDNNSLWYAFKKLQALQREKTVVLILDDFENFFSYPLHQREIFRTQLADLLFAQLPSDIKDVVDAKLKENPDLLTAEGYQMLYSDMDIRILISIDSDKLNLLDFFTSRITSFLDHVFDLKPFDLPQAREVFRKIASYAGQDKHLDSQPFDIDAQLLDSIIDYFARRNSASIVYPYQLQIIGYELEEIAMRRKLDKISFDDVPEIQQLYTAFYFRIIDAIEDENWKLNVRRFIEDELIFEYEHRPVAVYSGVARQRYKIPQDILAFLEQKQLIRQFADDHGRSFVVLERQAYTDPLLVARNQRIEYEINLEREIRKKQELEEKARLQELKMRRIKLLATAMMGIVLIVGFLAGFAYYQRKKAIKNQRLASSSLYSVLAFQKLDKDPTAAFRLAQKAYSIYPYNSYAQAAVLATFYKYGLFYQIPDTLRYVYDWAKIDPNTGKVLAIKHNGTTSTVDFYKTPQIIRSIDYQSIINFAFFLPDSGFITGGWDSTLYFYSPDAVLKAKLHLPGIVWTAAVRRDSLIAAGLSTGQIAIIDTSFRLIKIWKAHQADVRSLAFSSINTLASSSDDNTIKIWDANFRLINTLPVYQIFHYQRFIISPLHFSSDGQFIAAAINDYFNNYYVVRVWTVSGKEILNMKMADKWINDMIFLPRSDVILTASKDNSLTYYDLHNGKMRKFLGHTAPVIAVAYNPDKHLVFSLCMDKSLRRWLIRPFPGQGLSKITGYRDFVFSSDGSLIYVLKNSVVDVYDLLGNRIARYKSDCGKITRIKPQGDNLLIFAADNSITVWNPVRGRIKSYKFAFPPVDAVIVKGKLIVAAVDFIRIPAGLYRKHGKIKMDTIIGLQKDARNHLYIAGKNGISLFNGHRVKSFFIEQGVEKMIVRKNIWVLTRTGEVLKFDPGLEMVQKLNLGKVEGLDVSSDNQRIAVHSGQKIFLFSANGDFIYEYDDGSPVLALAFNPNSRFFIALEKKGFDTRLKHWICSAAEVIKYVDELKYFGNIPHFDETINLRKINF